jgi:hypothetical protein
MIDAPSSGSVSDFINGVEQELRGEAKKIWGPLHRPGSSAVSDAPDPPDEMEAPAYSTDTGWIDRAELSYDPPIWTDPSEVDSPESG